MISEADIRKIVLRAEKEPVSHLVASDYDAAIECYAEISLIRCDSPFTGAAYLKRQGVAQLLAITANARREVFAAVNTRGEMPGHLNPGRGLAFTHLSWLLDDENLALTFISDAEDRGHGKCPATGFIQEYARALRHLVERQPYDPKVLKLHGHQRQIFHYLTLISDITHGRDPEATCALAIAALDRLNRNKRLEQIAMEASAYHQVRWDFRGFTILKYARAHYGVTFDYPTLPVPPKIEPPPSSDSPSLMRDITGVFKKLFGR